MEKLQLELDWLGGFRERDSKFKRLKTLSISLQLKKQKLKDELQLFTLLHAS